MFRYAHDDLVRLLGPGTLDQWQACFRRGRVRECRIQSDGRSISGRIAGTEPWPYRATVHGTVEEKMLALQARKRTPTEGVLTGPHAAACR